MTSNLGVRETAKAGLGFSASAEAEKKKQSEAVLGAVKEFFRPEFLNRVDAQLVFHPLSAEEMARVFDIMMFDLRARLGEHGVILSMSKDAREFLLKAAAVQNQGARPLRRLIQTKIEDPLSDLILSGEVPDGSTVDCVLDGEALAFSVRPPRRRARRELAAVSE